MKTLIIFLLMAEAVGAEDLRNVAGAVVDLAPIYQWKLTNGPATNRPLAAWKEVQVLKVGDNISVYIQCQAVIEGVTNLIFTDHLPGRIKMFLEEEQGLLKQSNELQSFVETETKRLRLVQAESLNWEWGSTAMNKFLLDRATLNNKKDELAEVNRKLAKRNTNEASGAVDFAVLMNKKYLNLDLWDFGLKREVTTSGSP